MSEPLGFNISSLGDVESPEVVRGALRRFRRRVVRTTLIVLIVGLLAAGIVAAINRDPFDFSRQVEAAEDSVEPGTVFQSEGVTLILAKVADLGDRSGLHMVVVYPNIAESDELHGRIEAEPVSAGATLEGEGPLYDMWTAGPLPDTGRFDVVFEVDQKCTDIQPAGGGLGVCMQFSTRPIEERVVRFSIDLGALGIPERYWRKGGSS